MTYLHALPCANETWEAEERTYFLLSGRKWLREFSNAVDQGGANHLQCSLILFSLYHSTTTQL